MFSLIRVFSEVMGWTPPSCNGIKVPKWKVVFKPLKRKGASEMKITTIGIDLAKAVFGVHGVDERGKAVLRKPLKRKEVGIYKGLGGKGRVPPLPGPTCSEVP